MPSGSRKYLIDTNLYIRALRDKQALEELLAFSRAVSPHLYMSAVVAQELLAGTTRDRGERERAIIATFERRGRIVTPSAAAWKRSGEIIAECGRVQREDDGTPLRTSFWNDALIATSCRENGIWLITSIG